ncbi:BglG family transcription antiterminator [Pectinatus sottacetonis]|uniref:BglG family transcription antiterminator n=1 Tax=Pectinatus sottacetonis TaxID=1002795 RepID=UPI0018C69495|nr:BglG family transcription antiterminator [Pectinatus sottacetonis]
MKKFDSKIYIIKILLTNTEAVPIKILAQKINKNQRTVRNYLKEIKAEKKEFVLKCSKQGVFFAIERNLKEKYLNLYNQISQQEQSSLTQRQRQEYILKVLFLERNSYTIQLFADELFCSKSCIIQDLVQIDKWLSSKNITLCRRQNQGIWLEGEEKNLRLGFKKFLDEISIFYSTQQDANSSVELDLDYRINITNYKRICAILKGIDIIFIQKIVQNIEKKLNFWFTEQAFQNLVIHLAIAVKRIREDKFIKNFALSPKLKETPEYAAASEMINILSKKLGLKFPVSEIDYAAVHVLGSKIQINDDKNVIDSFMVNYGKAEINLARAILSISSKILQIDLLSDKQLSMQLVQHLRPTIIRMKQGLSLINPLLLQIKREYPAAYAAVWACNDVFENIVGVPLNENEAAYITMHLVVGISKYKPRYKAVVVCASGIGTSQFITNKLEQNFPNLEIVFTLPYTDLTEEIRQQADIVISTIKTIQGENTVYTSVLLTQNDRENINRVLQKIRIKKEIDFSLRKNDRDNNTVPLDIFDSKYCYLDEATASFEETVIKYGAIMEKDGFAKNKFTNDVIKREQISSTYIGCGIAIPHAKSSFVNRSKVIFIRLKEPIQYCSSQVHIILLLCLSLTGTGSAMQFFKNFYSILSDKDKVAALHNENDKRKIVNILNSGEINE